jgi:RNA polymerase sigma-70 factor (ECF subfamily)
VSTGSVITQCEPPLAVHVADSVRLEQAARHNYPFIWRCLRRFGIRPDSAVDDATQRVFEVAARKRHRIEPGHERAFFFKTALLVAAETRRQQRQRREVSDEEALLGRSDPSPRPDDLTEQRRFRQLLDAALDRMPMELRAVFVLFELEELPGAEIARLLEIPRGTVASRLRRAREQFRKEARRLRAASLHGGG